MDNINTAIYDLLWQKGPEDSRFSVPIPDTILYRHKIPQRWYFTSATGEIKRKHKSNCTTAAIEAALVPSERGLDDATDAAAKSSSAADCDICAVWFGGVNVEDVAQPKHVGRGSSPGAGSGPAGVSTLASILGQQSSGGNGRTSHGAAQFLCGHEQLHAFLFDPDKQHCGILQRFIVPKGERNEVLRCTWSTSVTLVEKRTCTARLSDSKHAAASARALTYEMAGADASAPSMPIKSDYLVLQLQRLSEQIAGHVAGATDRKVLISSMTTTWKMDRRDRLVLLWVSNATARGALDAVVPRPLSATNANFNGDITKRSMGVTNNGNNNSSSRASGQPSRRGRRGSASSATSPTSRAPLATSRVSTGAGPTSALASSAAVGMPAHSPIRTTGSSVAASPSAAGVAHDTEHKDDDNVWKPDQGAEPAPTSGGGDGSGDDKGPLQTADLTTAGLTIRSPRSRRRASASGRDGGGTGDESGAATAPAAVPLLILPEEGDHADETVAEQVITVMRRAQSANSTRRPPTNHKAAATAAIASQLAGYDTSRIQPKRTALPGSAAARTLPLVGAAMHAKALRQGESERLDIQVGKAVVHDPLWECPSCGSAVGAAELQSIPCTTVAQHYGAVLHALHLRPRETQARRGSDGLAPDGYWPTNAEVAASAAGCVGVYFAYCMPEGWIRRVATAPFSTTFYLDRWLFGAREETDTKEGRLHRAALQSEVAAMLDPAASIASNIPTLKSRRESLARTMATPTPEAIERAAAAAKASKRKRFDVGAWVASNRAELSNSGSRSGADSNDGDDAEGRRSRACSVAGGDGSGGDATSIITGITGLADDAAASQLIGVNTATDDGGHDGGGGSNRRPARHQQAGVSEFSSITLGLSPRGRAVVRALPPALARALPDLTIGQLANMRVTAGKASGSQSNHHHHGSAAAGGGGGSRKGAAGLSQQQPSSQLTSVDAAALSSPRDPREPPHSIPVCNDCFCTYRTFADAVLEGHRPDTALQLAASRAAKVLGRPAGGVVGIGNLSPNSKTHGSSGGWVAGIGGAGAGVGSSASSTVEGGWGLTDLGSLRRLNASGLGGTLTTAAGARNARRPASGAATQHEVQQQVSSHPFVSRVSSAPAGAARPRPSGGRYHEYSNGSNSAARVGPPALPPAIKGATGSGRTTDGGTAARSSPSSSAVAGAAASQSSPPQHSPPRPADVHHHELEVQRMRDLQQHGSDSHTVDRSEQSSAAAMAVMRAAGLGHQQQPQAQQHQHGSDTNPGSGSKARRGTSSRPSSALQQQIVAAHHRPGSAQAQPLPSPSASSRPSSGGGRSNSGSGRPGSAGGTAPLQQQRPGSSRGGRPGSAKATHTATAAQQASPAMTSPSARRPRRGECRAAAGTGAASTSTRPMPAFAPLDASAGVTVTASPGSASVAADGAYHHHHHQQQQQQQQQQQDHVLRPMASFDSVNAGLDGMSHITDATDMRYAAVEAPVPVPHQQQQQQQHQQVAAPSTKQRRPGSGRGSSAGSAAGKQQGRHTRGGSAKCRDTPDAASGVAAGGVQAGPVSRHSRGSVGGSSTPGGRGAASRRPVSARTLRDSRGHGDASATADNAFNAAVAAGRTRRGVTLRAFKSAGVAAGDDDEAGEASGGYGFDGLADDDLIPDGDDGILVDGDDEEDDRHNGNADNARAGMHHGGANTSANTSGRAKRPSTAKADPGSGTCLTASAQPSEDAVSPTAMTIFPLSPMAGGGGIGGGGGSVASRPVSPMAASPARSRSNSPQPGAGDGLPQLPGPSVAGGHSVRSVGSGASTSVPAAYTSIGQLQQQTGNSSTTATAKAGDRPPSSHSNNNTNGSRPASAMSHRSITGTSGTGSAPGTLPQQGGLFQSVSVSSAHGSLSAAVAAALSGVGATAAAPKATAGSSSSSRPSSALGLATQGMVGQVPIAIAMASRPSSATVGVNSSSAQIDRLLPTAQQQQMQSAGFDWSSVNSRPVSAIGTTGAGGSYATARSTVPDDGSTAIEVSASGRVAVMTAPAAAGAAAVASALPPPPQSSSAAEADPLEAYRRDLMQRLSAFSPAAPTSSIPTGNASTATFSSMGSTTKVAGIGVGGAVVGGDGAQARPTSSSGAAGTTTAGPALPSLFQSVLDAAMSNFQQSLRSISVTQGGGGGRTGSAGPAPMPSTTAGAGGGLMASSSTSLSPPRPGSGTGQLLVPASYLSPGQDRTTGNSNIVSSGGGSRGRSSRGSSGGTTTAGAGGGGRSNLGFSDPSGVGAAPPDPRWRPASAPFTYHSYGTANPLSMPLTRPSSSGGRHDLGNAALMMMPTSPRRYGAAAARPVSALAAEMSPQRHGSTRPASSGSVEPSSAVAVTAPTGRGRGVDHTAGLVSPEGRRLDADDGDGGQDGRGPTRWPSAGRRTMSPSRPTSSSSSSSGGGRRTTASAGSQRGAAPATSPLRGQRQRDANDASPPPPSSPPQHHHHQHVPYSTIYADITDNQHQQQQHSYNGNAGSPHRYRGDEHQHGDGSGGGAQLLQYGHQRDFQVLTGPAALAAMRDELQRKEEEKHRQRAAEQHMARMMAAEASARNGGRHGGPKERPPIPAKMYQRLLGSAGQAMATARRKVESDPMLAEKVMIAAQQAKQSHSPKSPRAVTPGKPRSSTAVRVANRPIMVAAAVASPPPTAGATRPGAKSLSAAKPKVASKGQQAAAAPSTGP